jgi:hypothetical protein
MLAAGAVIAVLTVGRTRRSDAEAAFEPELTPALDKAA